jgi:hypothetical protein
MIGVIDSLEQNLEIYLKKLPVKRIHENYRDVFCRNCSKENDGTNI